MRSLRSSEIKLLLYSFNLSTELLKFDSSSKFIRGITKGIKDSLIIIFSFNILLIDLIFLLLLISLTTLLTSLILLNEILSLSLIPTSNKLLSSIDLSIISLSTFESSIIRSLSKNTFKEEILKQQRIQKSTIITKLKNLNFQKNLVKFKEKDT